MNQLNQSFSVRFTYSISFTDGLFDSHNTLLADFLAAQSTEALRKKLLFVIDAGVLAHFPDLGDQIRDYFAGQTNVELVDDLVTVPGGEPAKNDPALVERIIDAVDRYGIDRHSYVVGVGGGSVLDLVGYAAAIAHRGIRHIRIPTTVLSQNDSGIGVKNGVNYRGKKNFLGTFAPPVAVFNDYRFLRTLDERDWRSGMAEAVKVALIKDAPFFDWIEANALALANRNEAAMQYLVYRCAELHMNHIAGGDPFEQGSSRPLDFGHWSAHKLEQLTGFSLRHGEAVAIGMALDCQYAHLLGYLSDEDLNRVLAVLETLGFALYDPALDQDDSAGVLRGLGEFREHLGGRLTILLLRGIGYGEEVNEMDETLLRQAIHLLANRQPTLALD
ncbi:3-dehydroquinate synthase [Rudanella paleaurantiibacter]|uniref:3-dehydroquinate synthase n=1 Tax=Rudanella paleaurantiibacter TaxID=2614655 RepID=A0A7J5U2C8_9BACT|nr:3-dehydroquinate synthase [Rudanella paleaurantiibacter]KAB7731798.1 3-dehydroquinate synthase [Rudanella paleaurantiibacter]